MEGVCRTEPLQGGCTHTHTHTHNIIASSITDFGVVEHASSLIWMWVQVSTSCGLLTGLDCAEHLRVCACVHAWVCGNAPHQLCAAKSPVHTASDRLRQHGASGKHQDVWDVWDVWYSAKGCPALRQTPDPVLFYDDVLGWMPNTA